MSVSDKDAVGESGSVPREPGEGGVKESGGGKRKTKFSGAQAFAHYEDRHERYILMTRDDLREIRTFGWLQEAIFGVGMFFFSGAFWLLAELLAHEEKQPKFEFTAWMGMCCVSMVFGLVLAAASLIMFWLRLKRLNKYADAPDANIP